MKMALQRGICYINGHPRVLVSADYPYYRDAAVAWPDRLRKLRGYGINTITCYIPWRHHQPQQGSEPDFSGRTQGNRDVRSFLKQCNDLGLQVIAKPGPFIHAETNYGGLPDWVCPEADPRIEPLLDAAGLPVRWPGSQRAEAGGGPLPWPLPAPLAPPFLEQALQWLRTVGTQLLARSRYPQGPVILAQIANEGIYSNAQQPLWAYDYSSSALRLFRSLLQSWYGDLQTYNQRHGSALSSWQELEPPRSRQAPETLQAVLAYIDWGRFQAEYMAELYRLWGEALSTDLPLLININPPSREEYGLDAWLARVEPERWPNVHYGFTNWVGVASEDPVAHERYLTAAKRAPGPNLEENWGFSILYERAFSATSTSFYQTLLALAGGATGFNVYTGVSTAAWDEQLDRFHQQPYPDSAPITARGEVTARAEIVRWLASLLDQHGEEFLACAPIRPVAWALYLPYARAAAWLPAGWSDEQAPACGRSLQRFQRAMRRLCIDYGLVNLQTASLDELARYPRLAMHGAGFMEREAQEKLATYVRRGGRIGMLGRIPTLDDSFAPCDLLAGLGQGLELLQEADYERWLQGKAPVRDVEGRGDIWLRSHRQRDVHYLIALLPADASGPLSFTLELSGRRHSIRVDAAAGGGALARIEEGRLSDVIVKGSNTFLGQAVAAACTIDGRRIGLDEPGDLAWIDGLWLECWED